jgi:hypothetical protein
VTEFIIENHIKISRVWISEFIKHYVFELSLLNVLAQLQSLISIQHNYNLVEPLFSGHLCQLDASLLQCIENTNVHMSYMYSPKSVFSIQF